MDLVICDLTFSETNKGGERVSHRTELHEGHKGSAKEHEEKPDIV